MEPLYEDNFVNLHRSAFDDLWALAPLDRVKQNVEINVPTYNGNILVDSFANLYCEVQMFYDAQTKRPYEIAVWDYNLREGYRWVHPAYSRLRMMQLTPKVATAPPACLAVEVDNWYETESLLDIMSKIRAIRDGLPHDRKVVVVLEFDEEALERLRHAAEASALTFDEFIEESIRKELERLDKKAYPNGYSETGVDIQ